MLAMRATPAVFHSPLWLPFVFALIPLPILHPHASWPTYVAVPVGIFLLMRWTTSVRITDTEVIGPCGDAAFLWRRRIPLEKVEVVPPPNHAYYKYALGTADGPHKITASFLRKKDQERLLRTLNLDVSVAELE